MCKDVTPCNKVKHRNVNGLIWPCVNNISYPSECKATAQPVQSFDEQTHMRAGLLHIHTVVAWPGECNVCPVSSKQEVLVELLLSDWAATNKHKQQLTQQEPQNCDVLISTDLFHSAVPSVLSIWFSHHALQHITLRMFDSVLFNLLYILFTVM